MICGRVLQSGDRSWFSRSINSLVICLRGGRYEDGFNVLINGRRKRNGGRPVYGREGKGRLVVVKWKKGNGKKIGWLKGRKRG